MSRDMMGLSIDEIVVAADRRTVDVDAVKKLARSISEIGLQHPITVRSIKGKFHLIAGRHRLEAVRHLGRETITAVVSKLDDIDARLWEISENLHRAELTKLERAEQIEEWRTLKGRKDQKGVQVVHPVAGGAQPHNHGVSETAAELGISRPDVKRAEKIAGLSDEAKTAARETGLDDNQSALLKVAAAPAGEQVARVHQLVHQKPADEPLNDLEANERQVAKLMAAWNASSPDARQEFLLRIEQPVMDRRFG